VTIASWQDTAACQRATIKAIVENIHNLTRNAFFVKRTCDINI
jgi:hypothetical protein